MRPMPNDSLKHLEKHAKGLLFPFFSAKAVFALKVWKNLKKNQNTPAGFELLLLLAIGYLRRALDHSATEDFHTYL